MAVVQNDVLRVAAKMSFGVGGDDLINVMHLVQLDAVSIPDPTALADIGTILEIFYTAPLSNQSSAIQYIDYDVKNVTQDVLLGAAAWPTFTVGGNAGLQNAPQVAGLIFFPTAKPRVQGRLYYGGLAEAGINDGVLTADTLAKLGTMAAAMLIPQLGSVGRYLYQVYNRTLLTTTNPVSAQVQSAARTQRRRSIGFGS